MLETFDPSSTAASTSVRKPAARARGYPVVGLLPGLVHDAPSLFLQLARQHPGALIELDLGVLHAYLATHPDQAQYVLNDNWRNFTKEGGMWKPLRKLLGNGLISASGDEWLRNRRRMQPLFAPRQLEGLVDLMVDVVESDLPRLEQLARTGAVIDMDREMMRLTQRIIFATMFGASITPRQADSLGDALLTAFQALNARMFLYFVPDRLIPGDRAFRGALAKIDEGLLRLVKERRRSGEERDDLLSLLLHARDESGSGMDDRQLRDELVTMFIAGNETTAITMTWLFYLLDGHPEVERKLRAEIEQVLGDRRPTAADLAKMDYAKMVIQEAMRLYPPSWLLPRVAKEDDEICGYPVRAGATVIVSQYVMHHDPAFWEDPERFDPERFTPERSASRPRYSFMPFGGGPRQCIGNLFAIMEAQILLAVLLRRLRTRLVPGRPVSPQAVTTLRPRHALTMTLHPA
ncbi:cytochrome P450 [Sorangium sp. So ce185]|uniref:cytochrome P450 n=1 Tax=Sorangium sp. So ce185 TaxID=3133287 RepID=UPI003F6370A7